MTRRHVYPDNHWRMRVDIPYSMGVTQEDLFFLCGQADLADEGEVRNRDDLLAQSASALDHIQSVVESMGYRMDDLSKLVVFFVPDESTSVERYERWLADRLGLAVLPVITLVPLEHFFYPGLRVEIDAYGITGDAPRAAVPGRTGPFSQAVRQGRFTHVGALVAEHPDGTVVAPGDVVAQSHDVLARLDGLLDTLGAARNDIVKINNWYVGGGTAQEWARSARVRADYYPEPGPVATGLPVASLKCEGLQIQTDCWIMLGPDGESLPKQHSWPKGHWDWPVHLPFKHGLKCQNMIFTGGQVSMNDQGEVLDHDDMVTQARTSMENIGRVIRPLGGDFPDIIKVNAFYAGTDSPDALHDNMTIRNGYFSKPGPASTGIPLGALAYEGMVTEFEIIAMLD